MNGSSAQKIKYNLCSHSRKEIVQKVKKMTNFTFRRLGGHRQYYPQLMKSMLDKEQDCFFSIQEILQDAKEIENRLWTQVPTVIFEQFIQSRKKSKPFYQKCECLHCRDEEHYSPRKSQSKVPDSAKLLKRPPSSSFDRPSDSSENYSDGESSEITDSSFDNTVGFYSNRHKASNNQKSEQTEESETSSMMQAILKHFRIVRVPVKDSASFQSDSSPSEPHIQSRWESKLQNRLFVQKNKDIREFNKSIRVLNTKIGIRLKSSYDDFRNRFTPNTFNPSTWDNITSQMDFSYLQIAYPLYEVCLDLEIGFEVMSTAGLLFYAFTCKHPEVIFCESEPEQLREAVIVACLSISDKYHNREHFHVLELMNALNATADSSVVNSVRAKVYTLTALNYNFLSLETENEWLYFFACLIGWIEPEVNCSFSRSKRQQERMRLEIEERNREKLSICQLILEYGVLSLHLFRWPARQRVAVVMNMFLKFWKKVDLFFDKTASDIRSLGCINTEEYQSISHVYMSTIRTCFRNRIGFHGYRESRKVTLEPLLGSDFRF